MENSVLKTKKLILGGCCLGICVLSYLKVSGVSDIATGNAKYPVTHALSKNAESIQGQKAPNFTLPGSKTSLFELLKKGPVVLLTIKKGCPCNLKAQPIFNNIANKYKNKATFIGVINSDQEAGNQFTKITKANFQIIPDPEYKILDAYKAKRAGYVYLIQSNGKIKKVWAGYSAGMLTELNLQLSKLVKTPLTPFDPQYAPKEMTSGCSLEH